MRFPTANIVTQYFHDLRYVLGYLPSAHIMRAIDVLRGVKARSGAVYCFGNGGSASTASHFAADLAKRSNVKAYTLADNVALFSAWSNDVDYDSAFARQLVGIGASGDVAVAISGSGNSRNVLQGVRAAITLDLATIGLTGCGGGELAGVVDVAIIVPSWDMQHIEDAHLAICHLLSSALVGVPRTRE